MTGSIAVTSTQRYARGSAIGAIAVAGAWHLANNLTGTVTGWSQYRWPWLTATAWLVIAVLITLAAADALRRTGRRHLALPLVGIPLLQGCVLIVLLSARAAGVFTTVCWAVDGFGWCAVLLLWRWPLRWLAVALCVNELGDLAVILATGPFDRVEISRYVVTMYLTIGLQIGLTASGRAMRRTAVRTAEAATEAAELTAARLAADEVHADRQRRYRALGPTLRELLAGLASGELDPADPAVQRRCAVEASRLRRLIAEHDDVPSPLVHELRACADLAERRGVSVALETAGTAPELPRQVRRALTEAPLHLLASARSQARVTVISTDDPAGVEVSVVADSADVTDLGNPARTADVEVTCFATGEGDAQWVRTRWTGR